MTEVYRVGYLERLPLGTPYPGIVAYIGRLLGKLPGAELVIDFTGVGRPVFDMFRFSGITPTGVLITSGAAETGGGFSGRPVTASARLFTTIQRRDAAG
jgi:hypothetical protein